MSAAITTCGCEVTPERSQPLRNEWFFHYTIRITNEGEVSLSQLRAGYESWFPNYMASEELPVTN